MKNYLNKLVYYYLPMALSSNVLYDSLSMRFYKSVLERSDRFISVRFPNTYESICSIIEKIRF